MSPKYSLFRFTENIILCISLRSHYQPVLFSFGGKQWQTTPKNLPRLQRTRAIPVAWLGSDSCQKVAQGLNTNNNNNNTFPPLYHLHNTREEPGFLTLLFRTISSSPFPCSSKCFPSQTALVSLPLLL